MRKKVNLKKLLITMLFSIYLFPSFVFAEGDVTITGLPNLGLNEVLSFLVKVFFSVAALVALYHLLMGAFQWLNSGGDKEAIESARNRIQAAVVGLILIFGVLSVAGTLEQVVFKENICFGITCDIKLPTLLKSNDLKDNNLEPEDRVNPLPSKPKGGNNIQPLYD